MIKASDVNEQRYNLRALAPRAARDIGQFQNHRLISKPRKLSILIALALTLGAAPANAASLLFLAPQSVIGLISAVPTTSGCFQYVYDKNGNRISSSTTNVSANGAVWGSATYGCAVWGA